MKNITLSADEGLIEAARERARTEHTTLNEQFRLWLPIMRDVSSKPRGPWRWSVSCVAGSVPVAASSRGTR